MEMGLYAKYLKHADSSGRGSKRKRGGRGTFLLSLMLILVIVISGCGASPQSASPAGASSAGNTTDDTASKAVSSEDGGSIGNTLTLMIYLCGSDLESKTGAATKDLDEIVASGVNTDLVNVVVMAGGTTQWQNGFSHEETAVYALTAASGSSASDADEAIQEDKESGKDLSVGAGTVLRGFRTAAPHEDRGRGGHKERCRIFTGVQDR